MDKFTCWSAASVGETVFTDIGALSRSTDAVFLAAHTPARVTHLRGPQEIAGVGGGEAQVLDALLADVSTYPSNTLIAVTGNSGTGKSHIVRWVYAQLRQPRPDRHKDSRRREKAEENKINRETPSGPELVLVPENRFYAVGLPIRRLEGRALLGRTPWIEVTDQGSTPARRARPGASAATGNPGFAAQRRGASPANPSSSQTLRETYTH